MVQPFDMKSCNTCGILSAGFIRLSIHFCRDLQIVSKQSFEIHQICSNEGIEINTEHIRGNNVEHIIGNTSVRNKPEGHASTNTVDYHARAHGL